MTPNPITDLAAAILAKKTLTDDQAALYAAVHVIAAGPSTYGAPAIDARYLDLLDPRVKDVTTLAPATPADDGDTAQANEIASLRAELADFRKLLAGAQGTPATAPVAAPAAPVKPAVTTASYTGANRRTGPATRRVNTLTESLPFADRRVGPADRRTAA